MSSASASPRAGRDHGVGFPGNIFFAGHFHNPFVGSTLSCCSMVGLEIKTFQTSKESKAQLGTLSCSMMVQKPARKVGTRKKTQGQRSCLMFCSCRLGNHQELMLHSFHLAAQLHNPVRIVYDTTRCVLTWPRFQVLTPYGCGSDFTSSDGDEVYLKYSLTLSEALKSFGDTFLASPLQRESRRAAGCAREPSTIFEGKMLRTPNPSTGVEVYNISIHQ